MKVKRAELNDQELEINFKDLKGNICRLTFFKILEYFYGESLFTPMFELGCVRCII